MTEAFDVWLTRAQRDLCDNLLLIDILLDDPMEESDDDNVTAFDAWRKLSLTHPDITYREVLAALAGLRTPGRDGP